MNHLTERYGIETVGSVRLFSCGILYRFKRPRSIAAHCDYMNSLVKSYLLQEVFPTRVVKLYALHCAECYFMVDAPLCGHSVVLAHFHGLVAKLFNHSLVRFQSESCRERRIPIFSRKISDFVFHIVIEVGIVKLISYRSSVFGYGESRGVARRMIPFFDVCRLALSVHTVGGFLSEVCKHVIYRFVCAVSDSEVVLSFVENICSRAFAVVRSQIGQIRRYGNVFILSCRNVHLAVIKKLYSRFLYFVFLIVTGVRNGCIQLNRIFTV